MVEVHQRVARVLAARITIGLYNSYDANHFHESMRRAVARAAPLALAFDFHLALIGFPFEAYRTKEGLAPRPKTPQELAALVADSTSIGEGGQYLMQLAQAGGFQSYPYPEGGFPPQLGTPVLATRLPDPRKQVRVDEVAKRARDGEKFLVLVGLGPRGVPKKIHEITTLHMDLTDRQASLETATAMGVLAGRLYSGLNFAYSERGPRLSVDTLVRRGAEVLLVRRKNPPDIGKWCLPGGFVDWGERTLAAAARELEEETGLRGRNGRLRKVYDAPDRDPRGHTVTILYEFEAEGQPTGQDDAAEAAFFPLDRLPPLAFDHARILDDVRHGFAP